MFETFAGQLWCVLEVESEDLRSERQVFIKCNIFLKMCIIKTASAVNLFRRDTNYSA